MLLAFVRGIGRWPVNSPYKGPVTQKMFLFDDVNVTQDDIRVMSNDANLILIIMNVHSVMWSISCMGYV